MKFKKIMNAYLEGLQNSNYEDIIKLFEKNGTVISPLYGENIASKFFRDMLKDTNKTDVTLLHLFDSESDNISACQFRANWTLKDGSKTQLNIVDIFEFSKNNKIQKLTLIYDASEARNHYDRIKQ